MEETGEHKGTDTSHRWIVDPLDGTTNFLHGQPHWCISIALERDRNIIAGLIYAPIIDELFLAERGQGATLNDRRIRVSARTKLSDALISCGIPNLGRGNGERFLAEIGSLQNEVTGLRCLSASALDMAWVAAGRFDAFWEYGLQPWDTAAASLLIREAGGSMTDTTGGERWMQSGNVLASNDQLHQLMLARLKG